LGEPNYQQTDENENNNEVGEPSAIEDKTWTLRPD
jgi:hypothetical protein